MSLSAKDNQYTLALRSQKLVISDSQLATDANARRCVIAGIRRSLAFAESPEVLRLCKEKVRELPEISRARNARLIMSDVIPEISDPSLYPYCIWHPDVACEQTYRILAQTYPALRYNVGRACAVAGYTTLYRSLGLLPEVSIAEEARENTDRGAEIFAEIMAEPVRYAVFNDYSRSINTESPTVAWLNGDTAVHTIFKVTEGDEGNMTTCSTRSHWDITEDQCTSEEQYEVVNPPLTEEQVPLLSSPLPLDLPAGNKDLLILMAAFEANIDRYARLRRPHMIDGESYCVLRGIHHSTAFAKWWSKEVEQNARRAGPEVHEIRTAINARFIMSNDLTRISAASTHQIPYMIWYPQWPQAVTLAELARVRPDMKRQVAHACIVADYQSVYDALDITPHPVIYLEAKHSGNDHYAADLERRAKEQDINLKRKLTPFEREEAKRAKHDKEPTSSWLYGSVSPDVMYVGGLDEGLFERGYGLSSSRIDLFMAASDDSRARAARQDGGWMMLHVPWYDEDEEEDDDPEDIAEVEQV